MTPRIAAFLRKSGAIPGISPGTKIDAIKMNTTTFQGGSLVSLLFLDGSDTPRYVLRIPRDRAQPERVLANYKALENLRSINAVAGTVPRPVFQGEVNGSALTVETCMHGSSLYAELASEHGAARISTIMDGVFDWLWRLHSATWTDTDPAFRAAVASETRQVLETDLIRPESAAYLAELIDPVATTGLPSAFCQGDFNSNNVLIAENGLPSGVVDWEYSGPGPAVFDLFSMLRTSLMKPESEAGAVGDQVESLLFGGHSATPSVQRALNRYAGPDNHRTVFLVYVVRMLAGFLRASGSRRDAQLGPWFNYMNSFPRADVERRPSQRALAGVF